MKTLKFLAISLLSVSALNANCESPCSTAPYTSAFTTGAVYGAGAGTAFDLFVKYAPSYLNVLPKLSALAQVSNDQLVGASKVSLAALASTFFSQSTKCAKSTGVLAAKLAGVIVGFCAANYALPKITAGLTSAAASVSSAVATK